MKNRKRREIPGHVTVENHRRAVFLPSEIDIAAYEKLAPEIIRLRLESSEPICLFIHSFGGVPYIAESILRLIRAPRQDGEKCSVTTVCIGMCRLLQKGENEFTASDAWYFGLVDEVTGTNLPSLRKWRAAKQAEARALSQPSSLASPSGTVPPGGQSPPASETKAKQP